ncbi:MAG TPA: hypothetical protein VF469_17295 [Kofleriaceae bacterium]
MQLPASKTNVTFDIAGLGAWQSGDSLQIVSPNAGMTMEGPENVLSAAPSIGSTTISGQNFDWKANLAPIIDATKGDTTWVTQMVFLTDSSAAQNGFRTNNFTTWTAVAFASAGSPVEVFAALPGSSTGNIIGGWHPALGATVLHGNFAATAQKRQLRGS